MKNYIFILSLALFSSCLSSINPEYESNWIIGHYQNLEFPDIIFSIGGKPVGHHQIRTPQFFYSTIDTIYSNFYVASMIDLNERKRWKLFRTNDNTYFRLKMHDNRAMTLYGPAYSEKEIRKEKVFVGYKFLEDFEHPLIPDSVLYVQ